MGKDELGKDDDDAFVKKLKNKMQKLNQDKNFINFLSREDDNIIEDK